MASNGHIDLLASTLPQPGIKEKEIDARVYIHDLAAFMDTEHFIQFIELFTNYRITNSQTTATKLAEELMDWHPKIQFAFLRFITNVITVLAEQKVSVNDDSAITIAYARKVAAALREGGVIK